MDGHPGGAPRGQSLGNRDRGGQRSKNFSQMNRKQLLILLVLVLALGGIGYYLRNNQDSFVKGGSPSVGKKLLGELPINDVASIAIKHTTNEVTVAKKDALWRVRDRNNYPANFAEISDFLIKAKDVKIVQTETVGASQLPRF